MKKESRRYLYIILVGYLCVFLLIGITAYFLLGPIKPWERKKLYNYYSEDANYVVIKGKITESEIVKGEIFLSIEMDVEAYGEIYENWMIDSYFNSPYFRIDEQSEIVAEGNGFLGVIEENKVFEFTTSFRMWWNGWRFPIVGISSEETVYLDYDTGKANFLEWIQG